MEKDIIRDPIHGYVVVYPWERAIIDTPEFQRLRYIKQTPGASYVYPGANHTRFEHSIGVLQLMGELIKVIEDDLKETSELEPSDVEKELYKLRIAALLHDLGHCPFSHVFEDFLREVGSAINHEDITQIIIRHLLSRLRDEAKEEQNSRFSLKDLTDKDIEHISRYAVAQMGNPEIPLNALIGNTIDVDKMDYLLRDSHHTGTVEYGNIDVKRILLAMKLVRLTEEQINDLIDLQIGQTNYSENGGEEIRMAISERAITSVESFLISRYKMYQNVYYHRTTRGIERTLIEMLKELANLSNGLIKKLSNCKGSTGKENLNKLFEKEEYLDEFIYNFNDCTIFSEFCKFRRELQVFQEFQKRNIFREAGLKPFLLPSDDEIRPDTNTVYQKLRDLTIQGVKKIAVDVPFPLLPIKPSKIFIINSRGNKIFNLVRYIQVSKYTSLLRGSFFTKSGEGQTLAELTLLRVYVLYEDTHDRDLREKVEKEINKRLKKDTPLGPRNI